MTKKTLPGIAQSKRRQSRLHTSLPHRGRGTASAAFGCFRKQHKCVSLSPVLPSVFHTIVTLSAPAGHLPLEGKATIREYPLLKKRRNRRPVRPSISPPVSSSRAQPRDLYCTAAIGTHAPSLKRHLGASFFAFPSLTVYRSAKRIVSHRLSYRYVELCLFEALYPAPLARPFAKELLVSYITPLVPKHATYLPNESPSALAYRHPERRKTPYVRKAPARTSGD